MRQIYGLPILAVNVRNSEQKKADVMIPQKHPARAEFFD